MKMSERAINAPQGVNARRVEATIMEKMPVGTWLTVTQTSRLIRAEEDRTRARLKRLVREGKIECKREQRRQVVYLYRRPGASTPVLREAAQLRALISDLRRTIRNFAIGVETEKDHAQDIKARRINLLATISSLETYLNDLDC